ncbi:MAG: translation elongation factor Ts [Candidatus Nomurabacteria bacterium]|nr:translation elongation factor Ts [Candidatus Nomurabacteria bacterium]
MSIQITAELVKQLRDATGVSVMQCKKALEEAEGNMDKAVAILKKNSSAVALKKADRLANDGGVTVKSTDNKAVLVTLHCETDFVAKNADFTNLLSTLADKALTEGLDKMASEAKDMIDPIIQKTGENIVLGESYEVVGDVLGNYVHNGKMAVVVSLIGGTTELAKDIAMHIAAMKPEFMNANEITIEERKTVEEISKKEVEASDKPEEIKKKILEGKVNTYFKERTLTDQNFIKNPDETIGSLLSKAKATIKEVKRYSI